MPEFLAAVAPQFAIISAGEQNPYGHPSPELLQRLQDNGLRVLRTDQDGAIQVVTDGRTLAVNCFVACPVASNLSGGAHTPNHRQGNQ
jgi:beta-lactamase superfamily II metal-dependent hydrolase